MSNVHKAAEVADAKKDVVKKVADLIKKYPIIGSINFEGLPAAQLQKMKGQLRGKVEMFMTKRRLMTLAIEQVKGEKKGIEKIEEHLKGMPALLFTNENPFSLFKTIKKSKTKAPAKAGQIAPSDIIVKAGPTSFVPGPVISELGGLGIKSKVEDGKINIVEDAVVCKEGEEISLPLAGMLTRLGIQPMEIGLDLVAVYEKGDIFTKSVLDIDEDKFMADLSQAASWALNLSCETAFVTELNREILIQKAFKDAKALALSENILADAVVEELLGKAERQMNSLKSEIPELPAAAEAKAETPKEEAKPAEEKAPEPAKEEPKPEPKPEPEAPKEEKAPEPAKEEPKVEEKKEEAKPNVDKKVENLVKQTQMKADGKNVAETLVEEAEKEVPKPEPKKEEPKVEEKKDNEVEKVAKLAETLVRKGTLQNLPPQEEDKEKPKKEEKKEKSDVNEVEDLTKELLKKGTLRK